MHRRNTLRTTALKALVVVIALIAWGNGLLLVIRWHEYVIGPLSLLAAWVFPWAMRAWMGTGQHPPRRRRPQGNSASARAKRPPMGRSMTRKPGTRVGAILSADDTTVQFLGWGVYDGYRLHEGLTESTKRTALEMGWDDHPVFTAGVTNPHITLDSGKEVWGCECWWGDAPKILRAIGDREVIDVDIDEARNR